MDGAALRRALTAASLQAPVRWDEVTGSTNATAQELAAAGAPEWTLVAAGHQTEGRGRLGRSWEDLAGQALICSLVWRPQRLPADRAGLLPLLAGAALAGAAAEVTGLEVGCKWPNDLLLAGEKVGGILAESAIEDRTIRYVVLGLGVNLIPPAGVAGAAGLGADVDPEALLTAFIRRAEGLYRPGDDEFVRAVLGAWRAVSVTLGRRVEATTTDGELIAGVAADVDERGGLVVDVEGGGSATVAFGEIAHLG